MQSSLISVVIPTFNREPRMLGAALDSVLAQDVPSLEIIVVDDGSATSAAQFVQTYGQPVRFYEQSNGGIASARNAGVALSRGNLLAFLDSDDLWEPDKLARQVEALRSDPGLEAVFGQAEQFYDTEVDDAFKRRHPIKQRILDAWLCLGDTDPERGFRSNRRLRRRPIRQPGRRLVPQGERGWAASRDVAPRRVPETYPHDEPQR